jgi:hypothetical protein
VAATALSFSTYREVSPGWALTLPLMSKGKEGAQPASGGGGGAVIETSVVVTAGQHFLVTAAEPEQSSQFGTLRAGAGRNGAGYTPGDGFTGSIPTSGDIGTMFGGGLPVYSSISGATVPYGGGGSPGVRASGTTFVNGPDGAGQYGYGGGGGGTRSGSFAGRVGGNGIVIVRWVSN